MKFQQLFSRREIPKFFAYKFGREARNMILYLMTDAFDKAFETQVVYPCEISCEAMKGYDCLMKNVLRDSGKTEEDFPGSNSFQKIKAYLKAHSERGILSLLTLFFGTLFDGYKERHEGKRRLFPDLIERESVEKLERYIVKEVPGEINAIFRANGLGYHFEVTQEDEKLSWQMIKRSDEFTYTKIIEPAWSLLKKYKTFRNADKEFTKAIKYLWGSSPDYENAIKEANSAFESVMKIITIKDPQLKDMPNETAVRLIVELVKGGYVRPKLQQGFQVLPTFANQMGRHGKGATIIKVGEEDAEFAINLAATYVLSLIKKFQLRNKELV